MKLWIIFLGIWGTTTAFAQFDKYKAEKKASTRGLDNFGRKEIKANAAKYKKEKKFVNLNPETAFGPEVVKNFDHPDTTLMELTRFMQKLTGINFILDKELKGKVSILAPTPITVGDAWKAYLTVLNMNGYTLVKSGAFYKIVSSRDKDKAGGKIYTGSYTPTTANFVMRVIPLKYIDSKEFSQAFRRFMSRSGGDVVDLGKTNTILLRDTGENINRIVRLIEFIDIPGHDETLQIIKVEHSSAQEIAGLLDQILSDQNQRRRGFRRRSSRNNNSSKNESISRIIADPRTNTIIAMANADGARRLRNLIKKLDSKNVASGGGQIHVYYLNHGNAETLSATLEKLVSTSSRKRSSSRNSRNRSTFSGNIPEISLFNNSVKITADKDNNALVITASPTDYLTIKEVIKKLDIPRDQVYVEGMIMETKIAKDKELGTSIVGAYGEGSARRFGFTRREGDVLLGLLTNQITSLGGVFGFQKGVKELMVGNQKIKVGSINGLITAIVENSNTNVLATPQILALDNTEAVFEMGESVPVRKETVGQGGVSTFSYTPQKVGLKLKITPRINKVTRFVKLEIDQTIGDFQEKYQEGGAATVERAAQTTVVVRDRDTIAMGGLMRDKDTVVESKVPLLGDIPILGWLFRNKKSTVEKMNLLMFMTPRILANYQKSAAQNTRDVISRRSKHLENVVKDDPFDGATKAIYEKTKKQERGPLYNLEEGQKYLKENEAPGIGNPEEENGEVPDYGKIIQKVRERKAATR